MDRWQIILALLILANSRYCAAQYAAPADQPPPATAISAMSPIIVPEADCTQSGPIFIAPGPVIYPPQSTVVPLPSHTPGTIFGPPSIAAPPGALPQPPTMAPLAPPAVNESFPAAIPASPPTAAIGPANPISVPVVDEEFAWDQIVDVVSDYFPVVREQRARRGGDGWSEGRIETAFQTGATWLEPHRDDSVGTFNRWESTFQTIRRRAILRVVPDASGYLVEAIVEKELEDLPTPENATAGAAVFRNDSSLPSRRREVINRMYSSPRWLQLGRDPALEQRMLAEIHARLNGIATAPSPLFAR